MPNQYYLYHVFRYMLGVQETYLVLRFIVGLEGRKSLHYRYCALSVLAILFWMVEQFVPPEFTALLYIPFTIISISYMIGIKQLYRALIAMLSFLAICEIDFFVGAVFHLLSANDMLAERAEGVLISVITMIVVMVAVLLCRFFGVTMYQKNVGKKKTFLVIELLVLLGSILLVSTIFGILSEQKTMGANLLLVAGMTLSLIFSVVTLLFYCEVYNAKEYKRVTKLNEKYEPAKQNDIDIKLDGKFPDKVNISDFDLCTIIANVIDNAIEACLRKSVCTYQTCCTLGLSLVAKVCR